MTREERLAGVLVELADTLVADFDVIDFLNLLADRNVELLGTEAAGLMLGNPDGGLGVIASSTGSATLSAIFELQGQEGPSLDCFRTGAAVVNLAAGDMLARWPRFWGEATRLGLGSAHALPMRLRDQVIGAVSLVDRSCRPGRITGHRRATAAVRVSGRSGPPARPAPACG